MMATIIVLAIGAVILLAIGAAIAVSVCTSRRNPRSRRQPSAGYWTVGGGGVGSAGGFDVCGDGGSSGGCGGGGGGCGGGGC